MLRLYGKGKQVYSPDDIDVLVAHIPPADAWYVIPIEAVFPCTSLRFYPNGCVYRYKGPRFEHFREAWHLLRPQPRVMPQPQDTIDIEACADPTYDFVHEDFWLPEAAWEGTASGAPQRSLS